MKPLPTEAIGTFALVFVGTGAIVVDDVTGAAVIHLGVSLAFGMVVGTMIFAVGDVSGAHFNPAVTLGFRVARRLPLERVAPFIAAQLAGALAASGVLRLLFPAHGSLGATLPSGGTVAMGALFGGPVSGASMNPARSLGPALVSGQLAAIWLYVAAPVLGAGLAVLGCRCTREPGCCSLTGAPADT